MRRCPALLLLVPPLLAFAPAPKRKDDAKDDLKKLQGTWQLVAFERDGVPRPELVGRLKAVVAGDQWSYHRDGKLFNIMTMKLDAKKKPREFEFRKEGSAGPVMEGIYALDGDTLKICYTLGPSKDGRPKEFRPSPGQRMQTFKREKR